MRKYYASFIAALFIAVILTGCPAPVVVDTSLIDTPEKGLKLSITELKSLVATAESLKQSGIIVPGTERHAKVKGMLQKAHEALRAVGQALSLGDLAKAESQEALFRSSLMLLRNELLKKENE